MRALFPTRALALLMAIGLLDLIATAALSTRGEIEELNPLMAPVLARGPFAFAGVKGATLLLGWLLLKRAEPKASRRACLAGSMVYLLLLGLAYGQGF